MKKHNSSKEQLNKSMERRVRHLMIQTLEKFEDAFSGLDNTKEGQIFKADIRTMFNDVIRAQRDEISDYDVEFRPLKLNDNGVLVMTQAFMQTIQKINFGFKDNAPFIKIYSSQANIKTLDAVRMEFGVGVLYFDNDNVILEIIGIDSCVNCVLPILDRYILHNSVRLQYKEWRNEVVKSYIGDRNG
jgi:hypothetical protein